MNGQVEQIGALQGFIERNPTAFLAALLSFALLGIAVLWVRALLRVEKLHRAHARAMAELQKDHAERVDSLRLGELERAVNFHHLVSGFVRVVEQGGIRVRPGRKPPTTNPRLPLHPEAPTLILGPDEEPSDAEDD